jgi:hypothetical protein
MFTPLSHTTRKRAKPFGYLYIIRWSDRLVKFGSTGDPYTRLSTHHDYLGAEMQLIGPILKFTSPKLANAVERFIHWEFREFHARNELFVLPAIAAQDVSAVNTLGETLFSLFKDLNLVQNNPGEGTVVSAAYFADAFIHAVESPCYWEQNGPLPPRPRGVVASWAKAQEWVSVKRSEESKAKQGATLRQQWQDPQFKAKRLAVLQEYWQTTDSRRKRADGIRKRWQDPEFKAKQRRARRTGKPRLRPQCGSFDQQPRLFE